jgi:hypothetical protein
VQRAGQIEQFDGQPPDLPGMGQIDVIAPAQLVDGQHFDRLRPGRENIHSPF